MDDSSTVDLEWSEYPAFWALGSRCLYSFLCSAVHFSLPCFITQPQLGSSPCRGALESTKVWFPEKQGDPGASWQLLPWSQKRVMLGFPGNSLLGEVRESVYLGRLALGCRLHAVCWTEMDLGRPWWRWRQNGPSHHAPGIAADLGAT